MKTDQKSRTSRKAPFLTSLALACAFMTGNAGAQGIPVIDKTNLVTNLKQEIQAYQTQLNTLIQKGQDYAQYAAEIKHMTQQLTQLSEAFQMSSLSFGPQFEKRSEQEGVSERCQGSGSGSIVGELFTTLGLDLGGDVVAQQRRLCTMIVVLENKKYNDSVDSMNKLMNETQNEINRQSSQISSADTNGKMDTNLTNSTNGLQQILVNHQKTQDRMKMYDDLIGVIKESQKALAARALKGQSSPLGTMINTGVLAAALSLTSDD